MKYFIHTIDGNFLLSLQSIFKFNTKINKWQKHLFSGLL